MKVKLITYTPNPVEIIYRSARTCYSAKTPTQMWEDLLGDNAGYGEEFYKKMCNFVEGILKTRHESVLEHANFTFACEGFSRACYSEDTKVLTLNGWKYFKDVDIANDLFATRNSSGDVEFHRATDYISYDYNGLMHHYHKQNLDILVTPNHNILMKKYDIRTADNYHLCPSEDIDINRFYITKEFNYNTTTADTIKISGYNYTRLNRSGKPLEVCTPDMELDKDVFFPFMAWYLSDGTVTYNNKENSYCVGITQTTCKVNILNKTRERISTLIENMGIKPYSNESTIRFKNQTIGHFLKQLGKSNEKCIPWDLFKEFNKNYAKLFIDEYLKGDGSIDTNGCGKLYTTSPVLAEQLHILCYMAGYTSKLTVKNNVGEKVYIKGVECNVNFPNYVIYVTLSNRKHSRNRNVLIDKHRNFSEVEYSGKVYCVTVPNNTLFVERNGMPVWCGNCLAQITRHRHCSFSVQSQRYVEIKIPYDDLQLMYHHAIELGDELVFSDVLELLDKYFVDVSEDNAECYLNCLLNYAKAIKDGKRAENARNFLPNAAKTNMIITMNLRELIHICHERMCRHAQREIRNIVGMMAEEVVAIEPLFEKYLQPKCVALGKCTERESCGFIKHNS